jgi:hypothetical protein
VNVEKTVKKHSFLLLLNLHFSGVFKTTRIQTIFLTQSDKIYAQQPMRRNICLVDWPFSFVEPNATASTSNKTIRTTSTITAITTTNTATSTTIATNSAKQISIHK